MNTFNIYITKTILSLKDSIQVARTGQQPVKLTVKSAGGCCRDSYIVRGHLCSIMRIQANIWPAQIFQILSFWSWGKPADTEAALQHVDRKIFSQIFSLPAGWEVREIKEYFSHHVPGTTESVGGLQHVTRLATATHSQTPLDTAGMLTVNQKRTASSVDQTSKYLAWPHSSTFHSPADIFNWAGPSWKVFEKYSHYYPGTQASSDLRN